MMVDIRGPGRVRASVRRTRAGTTRGEISRGSPRHFFRRLEDENGNKERKEEEGR